MYLKPCCHHGEYPFEITEVSVKLYVYFGTTMGEVAHFHLISSPQFPASKNTRAYYDDKSHVSTLIRFIRPAATYSMNEEKISPIIDKRAAAAFGSEPDGHRTRQARARLRLFSQSSATRRRRRRRGRARLMSGKRVGPRAMHREGKSYWRHSSARKW